MKEIGSIHGVKIVVDSMVPTNEAWLLTEDWAALFNKILDLKRVLMTSGVRLTGISVVAE